MRLSANGNYMKGARMHRLGNTLKRAVTVGAVLALTLGMATPATMSFADDAAGGAGQSFTLEQNQKTATELDENLETKVTLSFPGKREAEPSTLCLCSISRALPRRRTFTNKPKNSWSKLARKPRLMVWTSRSA